jgi:5-methylthioribose kinase
VQQRFMRELLADALGFCGAVIIRRLVGMAHTVDMDAIQPRETRHARLREVDPLGSAFALF